MKRYLFVIQGNGWRYGYGRVMASFSTCRNGATAVLPDLSWNSSAFPAEGAAKASLIIVTGADRSDNLGTQLHFERFNQNDKDPGTRSSANAGWKVIAAPKNFKPRTMKELWLSMYTRPLASDVGPRYSARFGEQQSQRQSGGI